MPSPDYIYYKFNNMYDDLCFILIMINATLSGNECLHKGFCISKTVRGDSRTNHDLFMQFVPQIPVQLHVIFRIFKRHQNHVAMLTSIMCMKILQNIKDVPHNCRRR